MAFEDQVGMPGAVANFVTITQVRYMPDSLEVVNWSKTVEAKFPGDRLSVYNLNGIGNAQVLAEVFRRAGPDLTPTKFIDAMVTVRDFHDDTHGGGITCTKIQKQPGNLVKIIDATTVD